MDAETFLSFNWFVMIPEFIILGFAAALSVIDLFLNRRKRRKWLGVCGLLGIVLAFISLLLLESDGTVILYDTFVFDSFAKSFKALLLIGTAVVFILVLNENWDGLDEKRGEFYYLFLTALLGAMFMASSRDLITLFIGLELLSLSTYILVGIRTKNKKANEASIKYFINGAIATAITLFGMSYLYGMTGTTSLDTMKLVLANVNEPDHLYMLALSFLIMFIGLSFKIATVPFHMWAPDVYEGAQISVTAFLSVISKTAGFILILRLFLTVFDVIQVNPSETMLTALQSFLVVLSALTMIIGNTVALKQKNIKRMFAYSAIAHAGYILVAFSSFSNVFYFDTIWFYLFAYLLMNLGAFAVIQFVCGEAHTDNISAFAGLIKRSPYAALAMTIFILSLAGIPGTVGFIAKISIFLSALTANTPQLLLAVVMIGTTIISYIYYFGILTQIYFREHETYHKIYISKSIFIVLFICIAGTLVFGIFPNTIYPLFYI
ncbi:NADH-quinone oxidoreductase subunit NuoN [Metabacillus fastidiosus]|uniref:NADH-quinone oxidoreductase subunit NuoN n=1 Tax=Metabacillus fastidiosus TaxID=1458 RepID=UPI002E1DA2EB|nr:NADH-quinone oxidoreductase subunit NuoN [Metabacillus fastidiosus]